MINSISHQNSDSAYRQLSASMITLHKAPQIQGLNLNLRSKHSKKSKPSTDRAHTINNTFRDFMEGIEQNSQFIELQNSQKTDLLQKRKNYAQRIRQKNRCSLKQQKNNNKKSNHNLNHAFTPPKDLITDNNESHGGVVNSKQKPEQLSEIKKQFYSIKTELNQENQNSKIFAQTNMNVCNSTNLGDHQGFYPSKEGSWSKPNKITHNTSMDLDFNHRQPAHSQRKTIKNNKQNKPYMGQPSSCRKNISQKYTSYAQIFDKKSSMNALIQLQKSKGSNVSRQMRSIKKDKSALKFMAILQDKLGPMEHFSVQVESFVNSFAIEGFGEETQGVSRIKMCEENQKTCEGDKMICEEKSKIYEQKKKIWEVYEKMNGQKEKICENKEKMCKDKKNFEDEEKMCEDKEQMSKDDQKMCEYDEKDVQAVKNNINIQESHQQKMITHNLASSPSKFARILTLKPRTINEQIDLSEEYRRIRKQQQKQLVILAKQNTTFKRELANFRKENSTLRKQLQKAKEYVSQIEAKAKSLIDQQRQTQLLATQGNLLQLTPNHNHCFNQTTGASDINACFNETYRTAYINDSFNFNNGSSNVNDCFNSTYKSPNHSLQQILVTAQNQLFSLKSNNKALELKLYILEKKLVHQQELSKKRLALQVHTWRDKYNKLKNQNINLKNQIHPFNCDLSFSMDISTDE